MARSETSKEVTQQEQRTQGGEVKAEVKEKSKVAGGGQEEPPRPAEAVAFTLVGVVTKPILHFEQ